MSDDVSKIKVGQPPSGIAIKTPPSAPLPGQAPAGVPPVPLPPRFSPPSGGLPSQIAVPPQSSGNPVIRLVVLAFLAIGLGAAIYWFISSRNPTEVAQSPTPSATATETPAPVATLADIFAGTPESLEFSVSPTAVSDFYAKIGQIVVDASQIKRLDITSSTKGAQSLNALDLMSNLRVTYPPALKDALGLDNAVLLYGQKEIFDSKGALLRDAPSQRRLALVIEVKDAMALNQVLQGWEPEMSDALGSLLNFDKTRASGPTFGGVTYHLVPVRYKNFPNPDKSIDYATVSASNGKTYFVLTSSRESMLSIVDALIPSTPLPQPSISSVPETGQ